ncbi:MAG TPA: CDP-diacylglycerol--glycerol-3-phosphate 3-phosphatidyltransferase [bacterium]|nr:CDP-diacylglycerol--glycerol-3-phosphate 3-phosphatidyltransferase [bacterium]
MENALQKPPSRWNTANLVTLSRIGVTPLFLFFIFRDELWAKWMAGLLFAWGAVSDYLDGYLARKNNWKTDFGALLDPLADKILFLSVFVSFVQLDLVPAWMVVIIAAREFLITGLRQVAQNQGTVIAASRGGKHKTISQIVAISVTLAIICAQATVETYQGKWDLFLERLGPVGDWIDRIVWFGPYWLMFYATVMSLVSGVDYFVKNRHVLTGGNREAN